MVTGMRMSFVSSGWGLTALALATLAALFAVPPARAETNALSMNKPLRLGTVVPDRDVAPIFERITLHLDLEAAYENPFDSSDIKVDAHITPPEGQPWSAPGFLYQPFTREQRDKAEHAAPAGQPEWQVRLSFPRPGRYEVRVTAQDASGAVTSEPLVLTAQAADVPGMVRRSPDDHRYFVTNRGETLYLSGANVCWGGSGATFDYDTWLPQYAAAGCNFMRVWLSPHWVTFAMNTQGAPFDYVDLKNAWRLDHVMETSERLGIRVMFCIDSFNILRSTAKLYGQWEESVYNQAHGGPLTEQGQYFTDEAMLKAYRDRLRYLVARYGYSPNVFAWEFWNEVDIIDNYDSAVVTPWHRDMARHLRAIDPWAHLIGTSHAGPAGDPQLDAIPELDFVQTHHYGVKDMASGLLQDRVNKAAAKDRPHFHGEFGVGHGGGHTAESDPGGIHLHNALYSSVGQMQAGTPMTWWWDSYVEPCGLYPVFAAFNRWIAGFDFVKQQAQPVEAEIDMQEKRQPRAPEDDLLEPKAAAWVAAPFNQPLTATISRKGRVSGDVPLPRLLHGIRNHADLHNPITFMVDAPEETTFGVIVKGVSGHGGAALKIAVDGTAVLEKTFADKDDVTDTLTKYDKVYEVPLTAGQHEVLVENVGNDWFYAAFNVPWLQTEPTLRALGVRGTSKGLIWVQSRLYAWPNATREGFEAEPVSGATLSAGDWAPGTWRVEVWDTVQGKVTGAFETAVAEDGILRLDLPAIAWDAALRLTKQ